MALWRINDIILCAVADIVLPGRSNKAISYEFVRHSQKKHKDTHPEPIEIEEEDVPDSAKHRRNSRGLIVTKCGRPSVKANELNVRYGASYRNSDNQNELFGKLLVLGKACAILGTVLYGPDIPAEESGHEERMRIFRSAAWYALTPEEVRTIEATEEATLRVYIKGLITASIHKLKYTLPNAARAYFQNRVFNTPRKDRTIQEHLGLQMHESVLDA